VPRRSGLDGDDSALAIGGTLLPIRDETVTPVEGYPLACVGIGGTMLSRGSRPRLPRGTRMDHESWSAEA
jgi:hypothetical protein